MSYVSMSHVIAYMKHRAWDIYAWVNTALRNYALINDTRVIVAPVDTRLVRDENMATCGHRNIYAHQRVINW